MSTRHKISAYGPGLSPTVAQTRYRVRVKLAGSARQERIRRRGAHSELFAPYIIYPPPATSPEFVTKERPRLVAVRTALARQRRRPDSALGPHHFLVYPPPAVAVVYAPVTVNLALSRRYRRPSFRLQPPQVVTTVTPTQDVFGGIMVVLAPQRRGRPRPVPIYPIVVFVEQALGWTAVYLTRTPRAQTISFLTPPVVDTAVLPVFYGPPLRRVVSRRMVLYWLAPPSA